MVRSLLVLAALLAACDAPQGYTAEGVVVHAPTYAERVDKALAAAGSASLSFGGAEKVKEIGGKVLADRPDSFSGLPEGTEVAPLLDDPAIRDLLLANDEAAAAKAIREKGGKIVLVHAKATPSVDRGGAVLSRLYHHDWLDWFSLFRVGEDVLYYEVLDRPVSFPPQLAAASVGYLRARLEGRPPGAFPEIKSETGSWSLIGAVRGQGRELAVALAKNKDFQGALEELVVDIERQHRRDVELLGFPPLARHVDDLSIEVHRVTERAYIEPRDEAFLESYWEMGIDGAYVMSADQKERGVLPGAASYTRSLREADRFLREVAQQGDMSERRPWRADDAWLESLRTLHFREIKDEGITFLYRGVPAVPLDSVSLEAVRVGIVHAGDWYMHNLTSNGQVIYKYWPAENRYSDEYNHVRHTLATWNLVQSWRLDQSRTEFLEGSKAALAFTQAYLEKERWPQGEGDMAFYTFDNNRKLGSVVVNMLGVIDLARATGDSQWDDLLRELGRFTMFMQQDNGSFRPYYVDEGHPYFNQRNDIVPGEAALALVHLADYFGEDAWIAGIPRFIGYYKPWFEERAVKANREAPWPQYLYDNQTRLDLVQFGPWTVMAMDAYHRRTGDAAAAEFGLAVARWMIESYQWNSDRAPFPDYLGGYYKMQGELPAMQAFCYAEGTAAAYALALRAKPDEAPFFEKATRETLRFALQMQYYDDSTYPFSRPEQVDGGIRYAMNETKVRIDYVYHAESAMYQWYMAAKDDPNLPESVRTGGLLPMQQRWLDRVAKEKAEKEAAIAAGSPLPAPRPYAIPLRLRRPGQEPTRAADGDEEKDGAE